MKIALVSLALTLLPAAAGFRDATDVVKSSGIKGGLVVHLGCGDGKFTAALRTNDSYIVQGLDTDAGNVSKARRYIKSLGIYGKVTADTFDGEHLPYTDNLVNLLVVSDRYHVSKDEMLRVLAPGGVACDDSGGDWVKMAKPWPKNIDQWTHYLHGPDNNAVAHDTVVGPPRHMQWLAAPRWTRHHHSLNSISSVVTAGGRIFYIVDEATPANMAVPGKWMIVARDAFSGVELWKKRIKTWAWHRIGFRSGPPQVTRLLVASRDRVYAPLGLNAPISAIDAVTGDTLKTYGDTKGAEEIIVVNEPKKGPGLICAKHPSGRGRQINPVPFSAEILLTLKGSPVAEQAVRHAAFRKGFRSPNKKSIVASNTESGKTLWQWSDPEANPMPETLASDGRKVYFQVNDSVTCLDLASGKELWTFGRRGTRSSNRGYGKYTLVVADDVVLSNLSGKLTALSAEDGKELWQCRAGGGFHSPLDLFVIDGLVWQGLHVSDSVAPPPVSDFHEGRDLHTGEVKSRNSVLVDLQTAGHHHRCYREKATDRYIITGKRGVEMMDLAGDNHSRNNWVRGTCQYGIMPANGLLYAPAHACGCYMESKLWGFWALAAKRDEGRGTRDEGRGMRDEGRARLERGPAHGFSSNQKSEISNQKSDDWPLYRHDPRRSGVAGTIVPAKLKHAWKVDIGGALTQPVVAGGKVAVSAVDENTVYVLDEKTGKVIWDYIAGGRVDSPPAIYNAMVLFGSADGWVYCLRLSDGELIWRFLAAPADLKTVALDQVESLWPVHGSVLVLGGVAYCSAGRSTWLDGGIVLYGLDPATGKVVHTSRFQSRHPRLNEGKDKAKKEHVTKIAQNTTDYKTFLAPDRSDSFSMAGGSVTDVLVSDGKNVFMHHVKFNTKLEKQQRMSRHLFSTSGLLDGSENHRSHWVLGTGNFSRAPVAYSWIVNGSGRWRDLGITVPTGLMMVYDDHAVWGVRRKKVSGTYFLFEKDNTPFSDDEKPSPDFHKISKDDIKTPRWSTKLTVRPRAMLKSGDHLCMGVMPADVPSDNPYAAYEGRKGGMIWIVSAKDGSKVAQYKINSPVVWDGMAAAGGRLFVCTENGQVQCWSGE